MLCPKCSYFNDAKNKFCNMCSAPLPKEDAMEAPVERDSLDLDLTLDFDDLGINVDEKPSDFSAYTEEASASDGLSDVTVDLDMDLDFTGDIFSTEQAEVAELELSDSDETLDFSEPVLQEPAADDLSLDLDLDLDLDLYLSADTAHSEGASEVSLDLDLSAPEEIDLSDSDDLFGDLSIGEDTIVLEAEETLEEALSDASEDDLLADDFELPDDLNSLLVDSQPPVTDDSQTQSAEQEEDELLASPADSLSIEVEDSFAPVALEAEDLKEHDESFDFGDLDQIQTIDDDDDLQSLTISFDSISSQESFEEDVEVQQMEDDGYLHEENTVQDASGEFVLEADALEQDLDLEAFFQNDSANEPVEESGVEIEASEVPETYLHEDDSSGIFIETDDFNLSSDESFEMASEPFVESDDNVDSWLLHIGEPENKPKKSLHEEDLKGYQEGAFKTEVLEQSPSYVYESDDYLPSADEAPVISAHQVLSPVIAQTPLEELEELRVLLKDSEDPDERYSLVLQISELGLQESVPDFVALLNDELKDIREIAADYLGTIGNKEAVKPLIDCLSSPHPQLKFIAARSIGKLEAEEAVMPLIKLLEEEDEDLRYVTLESLGKIGSSAALKAVSAFLKSRNNDLRYIACEAVGNIGDPGSVAMLLPMLRDPEFDVRLKAIEALGKVASKEACDQLLVVLSEDNEAIRSQTIKALGQIKNENAVEPLVELYPKMNPQLKEQILWALGEIGSAKAVEPMLKLSNSFNSAQVKSALEAFGKIKSEKASRYVLSILERDDSDLSIRAIAALGEIKEKSTAGNLIKFLESPDSEIKIAAATALGNIANPIAIDALIQKLSDSEKGTRYAAIEALGKICGVRAIDALINSLNEQDEQIIEKAEWAICEMGEAAVDHVNKAIQDDKNASILPSLVKILGKIGSIRAIFPLLQLIETHKDLPLAKTLADSLLSIDNIITGVNPISVILKEGYAWAQFSIAKALAEIGDDRAFNLLIKIAGQTLSEGDFKKLSGIPDKRVLECSKEILHLIKLNVARLFAEIGNDNAIPVLKDYFIASDLSEKCWTVEAIGGINTDSALDALTEILKKPEYNIPLDLLSKQIVRNSSKKLVEKLVMSASHPSEQVRMAVATVLGDTGDTRAMRTLSALVKDQAEKVRVAAIDAIGSIGTTVAVQPAIDALSDSVESVRAKAAEVLGGLNDTAAVEFLQKSSKDSSELVRKLSIKSLAGMADARVPDIITAALKDQAESVRITAAEALGERRERAALPHLIEALGDESDKLKVVVAEALAKLGDPEAIMPLLPHLDSSSHAVPLACSEAIISFGENAYPMLIEALKNPEPRIRHHASELLVRISDDSLIGKLLRLAQDRNNFLRENVAAILGKVGDSRVVDTLIMMLSDRSILVRKTAAEALGNLKDIRSVVALKQATKDQSREVRKAANAAMQAVFQEHKL
ncbi:MAG: hypothetical protein GX221_08250 [Candidatus Riflebacteria bacterium]|nr:hypothetical protein [Candidatus Riflebacteria bacterium]